MNGLWITVIVYLAMINLLLQVSIYFSMRRNDWLVLKQDDFIWFVFLWPVQIISSYQNSRAELIVSIAVVILCHFAMLSINHFALVPFLTLIGLLMVWVATVALIGKLLGSEADKQVCG
jgi:hypothetical protein